MKDNEEPFRVAQNLPPKKMPFFGGNCYACDAKAVGLRDRRPEGGELENACTRHRDPTIQTYNACVKCMGPTRKGSLDVGGQNWHRKCHEEECK